jgi:hypothetical protein
MPLDQQGFERLNQIFPPDEEGPAGLVAAEAVEQSNRVAAVDVEEFL